MDLAIKKLPLDWTLRGKWGTVANCLSLIKPSPFLESELRGLLIPSTRISSSSAPLLSSGSPKRVKINKLEQVWTSLESWCFWPKHQFVKLQWEQIWEFRQFIHHKIRGVMIPSDVNSKWKSLTFQWGQINKFGQL